MMLARRATLALALVIASCASGAQRPLPALQGGSVLPAMAKSGAGKIKHVVFIVQENRSFDNLFQGYPGADTVSEGKLSTGQKVALKPAGLRVRYDVDHSVAAMIAACRGRGKLPGTRCQMDGFDREPSYFAPPSLPHPQYVYVPHKDSKPYFDMAHEWVVADRMFQSQLDESFVAHQYVIAAQAQSSANLPQTFWGCSGGPGDTVDTITEDRQIGPPQKPCFDYQTLGDEIDAAHLTWRFYTSKFGSPSSGGSSYWSSYQAVKHIYEGPDWKRDVINPQKKILLDVPAGTLANFTWITPLCDDSDHVNCGGGYGPSWVAAIVNTIGKSKFWDSTAIFVVWDDWGGLYDHVPPPFKDYDGVGFRVPLLVISPYARHGHVSHVQYETASVLRFAEDLWGLRALADADRRAASPAKDCFDFSQKPRAFVPIEAPKGRQFFLRQRNDLRAPDDQ